MKHLKKFNEELDYLSRLKKDKQLDTEFSAAREQEIEDLRLKTTGNHLPTILKDKSKRETTSTEEVERKELTQKVIDGLVAQFNNKPGYDSFKEELVAFLEGFPKE